MCSSSRPLHIGDTIRGAPWRVMFEISSKVATTHYTVPFHFAEFQIAEFQIAESPTLTLTLTLELEIGEMKFGELEGHPLHSFGSEATDHAV